MTDAGVSPLVPAHLHISSCGEFGGLIVESAVDEVDTGREIGVEKTDGALVRGANSICALSLRHCRQRPFGGQTDPYLPRVASADSATARPGKIANSALAYILRGEDDSLVLPVRLNFDCLLTL